MGQRSVGSATISFGLVSIPVKLYMTASAENVRFNMITKDGNRVKTSYVDSVTGKPVDRAECNHGFEYAKGEYAVFTTDELQKLRADKKDLVEILEFIDADNLDHLRYEKNYYLGPNKGADKGYLLLIEALKRSNRIAIARQYARAREHLVALRPHNDSLILSHLFYNNEMRSFENPAAKVDVSKPELDLAMQIVSQLTNNDFDISKYYDGYVQAVGKAVEQKLSGQTIVMPAANQKNITDLFEALKQTVAQQEAKQTTKKASKKKTSKKKKAS